MKVFWRVCQTLGLLMKWDLDVTRCHQKFQFSHILQSNSFRPLPRGLGHSPARRSSFVLCKASKKTLFQLIYGRKAILGNL